MTTIQLNGARFVKGRAHLGNGQAPDGYYVLRGDGGVHFYDPDGEPVAVINARKVFGCATRLADGRVWYSYATPPIIGAFPSYGEGQRQVAEAFRAATRSEA